MKQYDLSRTSWAFVFLGFIPMFLVLFHPSLKEYLTLFAVDTVALLLIRKYEHWIFLKLYPDTFLYFMKGNIPRIAECNAEEKLHLFKSMRKFPSRRALYCSLMSFIKAIPGAVVIVFYWKHENSNWEQLLTLLLMMCVMYCYFYGAVFIENHILISEKIEEFHKAYDWSEAFQKADLEFGRREFEFQEFISLFSIGFFMLLLQWLIITNPQPVMHYPLGLQISVVGIASLAMIFRIWSLKQKLFVGGLTSIFSAIRELDPENPAKTLPLHSSPILGYFEQNYNSMLQRLRSYRQELNHWVNYQTEESRYRALGEISALVVHDLSAPLHVIGYCTDDLQKNPKPSENEKYFEQIAVNGRKSLELIDSLKTYLKNSSKDRQGVRFVEALESVLRLLDTQYYSQGLVPVKMDLDPELNSLRLALTKADFIHVLLNLLRNSYDNFFAHRHNSPAIAIKIEGRKEGKVCLTLQDNGSGLSSEHFEEYTSLMLPAKNNENREGLGLRLVRRLVERHGGSLKVGEDHKSSDSIGTKFYLELFEQPQTELNTL